MIAVSTILLLFLLASCTGRTIFDDKCSKDTSDFAAKVENSTFVVLGKSKSKVLYPTSDTVFYATFQVDCIFKGVAIPRLINITEAGQVEGRTYCQELPVGQGYTIAFLERNPSDSNETDVFIPADFVEMPYEGNTTIELLADTCDLHRVVPLGTTDSIIDLCPAVSTASQCVQSLELTTSSANPLVIPGGSVKEVDIIRSKSGTIQVEVDRNNGVRLLNLNILLMIMFIIFARLC